MTRVAQNLGLDPSDPFMSGNTLDIPVTIDDPPDVDLTDVASITWQVHRAAGNAFIGEPIIVKDLDSGITVTSPTTPATFNIHLDSTDTKTLEGLYYHEAEVRWTGGAVHTVFLGQWQIQKEAVE